MTDASLTDRSRDTRAALLSAARDSFARQGYDRTTMRAVAKAAGCNVALINRYFGGKQGLFLAAVSTDLELPDLTGLRPMQAADTLLRHFLHVWEDDPTLLSLMRASAASPEAAEALRGFFVEKVVPHILPATPDAAPMRAALAGSLVTGMAWGRHIMENPILTRASRDEIIAWATPILAQILSGPAPKA